MAIWMGSDFHWTGRTLEHQMRVQSFLDAKLKSGERLILGGDILDVRVGRLHENSPESRLLQEWLQALLVRGVQVDWIEGNHDFHLEPMVDALRSFGTITLHTVGVTVPVSGRRTLRVEHGDLADSKDHGYRFMRFVFRSALIKVWSIRFAHIGAEVTAARFQRSSLGKRDEQAAGPLKPSHIERIRKTFRSYAAELASQGHDWVVLGHCHDADAFEFKIGERRVQYQNNGFPKYHGFLLCLENAAEGLTRVPIPAA